MFDYDYRLNDGGLKTVSGYGEVIAAAKVVNLGAGLVRGNVIIDLFSMAMADSDEIYQLHLLGGDDSSFTNEVALATLEIGTREAAESTKDAKLGRYILPFQNEQNGVIWPYVRIRHTLGGTSPSIDYVARLEKDLPVRGKISATQTTTTT